METKPTVFGDCTPFVRQGSNKGKASKLASELKAPHKHVVMRNAYGCRRSPYGRYASTSSDYPENRQRYVDKYVRKLLT